MKPAPLCRGTLAFTLVEALVVIILAIVVLGLLFPVPSGLRSQSANVKALNNARQIGIALRMYANDHDNKLPSFTLQNGKSTNIPVPDSNTAFAQLFPTYIQSETIFWIPKSAFCSANPPDGITDNPPLDTPVNTLKQGENEWAYVPQISEFSDPDLPLIASGFADPVAHTYTTDTSKKGGRWKGAQAIVVRADGSCAILPVDKKTLQVTGSNGVSSTGDLFTTANSAKDWLAPENAVVNPK